LPADDVPCDVLRLFVAGDAGAFALIYRRFAAPIVPTTAGESATPTERCHGRDKHLHFRRLGGSVMASVRRCCLRHLGGF
jgi:hypothetical protein